jgi:hypothetical protein
MATKAPLLSQELKVAMKDVRLGQLLATLPERILLAEKGGMPLQDFLLGLFTDEVERRRGAAASRRADHAGLDPGWSSSVGTRAQRSRWIGGAPGIVEPALRRLPAKRRHSRTVGVGKTFVADRAVRRQHAHHRRLRSGAHDSRRKSRCLPALRRAHGARSYSHHEQSRHV